jgi:hypothetical protein
MWAGLIALADQYAGRHLGFVNAAVYPIGRSAHYRQAFRDVTGGNNSTTFAPDSISGFQAQSGWDPMTGGAPRTRACSSRRSPVTSSLTTRRAYRNPACHDPPERDGA